MTAPRPAMPPERRIIRAAEVMVEANRAGDFHAYHKAERHLELLAKRLFAQSARAGWTLARRTNRAEQSHSHGAPR